MSKIHEVVIRFKQSDSADVKSNNVYIHAANTPFDPTGAFDSISPVPTPDADGFSRIPLVNVPKAAGLEGQFDIDITAVDGVGNESDPLEIDNATFDLSPPDAPTDGALE
jgi:hypothetical protein